jgi:3'(2'), 5'-bisphosphate nucleotidase
MDSALIRELLEQVCGTVRAAGEAILGAAAGDIETDYKRDGSPITTADRAAHHIVSHRLRALEMGWPVISEEGSTPEGPRDGPFWLVDPLDGTREFRKGLDEYTVNVALVEEGRPVLGAVHAPARSLCYFGAEGTGAWREDMEGVHTLPLEQERSLRPVGVISRSHASDEVMALLERLGIQRVVRRGSSLKMCSVAEDSAQIYPRFGPTYPWDTAAGTAVARAAGCKVLDLTGRPLDYSRPSEKHHGFVVYRAGSGVARELESMWQSEGAVS